MAALPPAELYALTQRTFGDLGPDVVNTMYQIALRESGGDPAATNLVGNDRSYGLWQINTIAGANPDMLKYDLTDPEQNAKAAREIYDRQGPQAWSTYNSSGSATGFNTQMAAPTLTTEQRFAVQIRIARDYGVPLKDVVWTGDSFTVMADISAYPGGPVVGREAQVQVWPTGNGADYTYEPPKAAGSTANQQAGSLPTGYTFDPASGNVYRIGDNTRTPVSAAELQAAQRTESAVGRAPTNMDFQIDPKTGDLVSLDPVTGQLKTVKSGFGYPEVSPYQAREDSLYGVKESGRQADNRLAADIYGTQESGRQSDSGFKANIYGTQESGRQSDNVFKSDIYGTQESGRQSDNSLAVSLYGTQDTNAIRRAELGQKDVIDRAGLMENARQANLEAALRQFETRANLIPEFGDLALRESDAQRQILSQGGDFLYRAFRSQGQDSPLPLVTQADLMAHLRQQLAQLNGIIPPEALKSGTTSIGGFSIPAAAQAPTLAPAGAAPTLTPAAAPPTLTPMAPPPIPAAATAPKLVGNNGMTWTPTPAASGAQIYVPDGVPDWVKTGLVNQYAEGSTGFVMDKAFISGDPKPGRSARGANPEMVYNPTGAPIAVQPLDRMPPPVQSAVNNPRDFKTMLAAARGGFAPGGGTYPALGRQRNDVQLDPMENPGANSRSNIGQYIRDGLREHTGANPWGNVGQYFQPWMQWLQQRPRDGQGWQDWYGQMPRPPGQSGQQWPQQRPQDGPHTLPVPSQGDMGGWSPPTNGAGFLAPWGDAGLQNWQQLWSNRDGAGRQDWQQLLSNVLSQLRDRTQQPQGGFATPGIRGYATGTSYSAPAQTYQYPTTAPTPLPDYFSKPTPTQPELLAAGTAALPPAIKALYQGGAPQQRRFDSSLPTARQFSMLTDEELKAYDTYSRLKDQTPLADIAREIQQRYAPSASGFTYRPKTLVGIGL